MMTKNRPVYLDLKEFRFPLAAIVSIGHRVDLDSAVKLVLRCAPRYRLPEPIRAAHRAAAV